ncbi:MAG: L-seryl-tRNA(Sec) selenium transferase [Deltaproteobacteria bacterium]|nr:MAG: L-seryl-tRNA(Sec) selenium transferase [Deltaproteobacteria bacterium]
MVAWRPVNAQTKQLLRRLPKVDALLRESDVAAIAAPRWAVAEAARRAIDRRRRQILAGEAERPDVTAAEVEAIARDLVRPSLRRVINATGVVLHTNLGRAPLPEAAADRVREIATGYSNLEYDVDGRSRGSRHAHLAGVLRDLTGAEDVAVVNNNAGAVLIALSALAAGREVVVSRGELVEIGGSFRIPDVMRLSGARLVEVGTTNKTHARDYTAAICDDTALLLKVHRSNFDVVGFTAEVELDELVAIGRAHGLPTMIDLGSGALITSADQRAIGLPGEPSVREALATGVDLATFSGDKLLGGPQAGVLAGRAAAISAVRAHPLMRALRPDKMTIAALEATASLYRDGALDQIPAIAMLRAGAEQLRARADAIVARVGEPPAWLAVAVRACDSAVGGGAMPRAALPSWAVALRPRDPDRPGCSAGAIDRKLRARPVPIVGRIADDEVWLDVRTVRDAEVASVADAIRSL